MLLKKYLGATDFINVKIYINLYYYMLLLNFKIRCTNFYLFFLKLFFCNYIFTKEKIYIFLFYK